MGLWIADSGLPEEKIRTGVAAAQQELSARGVEPGAAHAALCAMLDGEEAFDREAVEAWENAETAAFRAVFAGLEHWPEAAALSFDP
jgi:hypothetical protein